jgi:hypothetical protein
MQLRIPVLQSAGAIIIKITIMSICKAEIEARLNCNHLLCAGFISRSDSVRRKKCRETIKVATATIGVKTQAINPGERKPSNPKIIIEKAIRSRIIVNKAIRDNCRRQFTFDAILRTNIAGRGPEMSGRAKDRKNSVFIEATCPTILGTE